MLSYETPRALSLNLNLQNTTTQSQTSSDAEQHEHEDTIDESTKLLKIERQDYVSAKNGSGNWTKNVGSNKINYNMNITNNNLCNNNLININSNHHNISTIKNGQDDAAETDSVATNENNVNNNDETNSSNNSDKIMTEGKKIIKMTKLGSKNVTLKRVSFGSSKGSMVETLVFETPTPLPEHAEKEFFSSTIQNAPDSQENGLDDSGIELQEELERSRVKVSFFQSSKPQQISPPCSDHQFYFGDSYFNNNSLIDSFLNETDSKMTAVIPDYDRQMSTDSGWDNPFRPDGDLSREADEIVNLIKGGKPITPTGDHLLSNGSHLNESHETNGNGMTVVDGATKLEASPLLNQPNGTKSPQKGATNGDVTKKDSQPQLSNQTVPGPQSASCVVIDEKKKKSCKCCVIQ